ncbi:MAG: NAD(P)-dependent oxidoreductase [Planctomycetota bacterium]
MNILLLGGSSWLASQFIQTAKPHGHRLTAVSRIPMQDTPDFIAGDCTRYEFVSQLIKEHSPDVVVNFCGVSLSDSEMNQMVSVNCGITTNVMHALTANQCQSVFITFGSAAEYGRCEKDPIGESDPCMPETGYALTKYQQTLACLDWASRGRSNVYVLRPFNLIGPGMPPATIGHLVDQKIREHQSGDSVVFYYPDMVRDFISLSDVAAATLCVAQQQPPSGVYNICSGVPLSLREMATQMLTARGVEFQIQQDERFVGQPMNIPRVVGDPAKLKRECHWQANDDLSCLLESLATSST